MLLVLLMLGRAAFVFPISFMHNLWSREKLALREMVVIWSALTILFCMGLTLGSLTQSVKHPSSFAFIHTCIYTFIHWVLGTTLVSK